VRASAFSVEPAEFLARIKLEYRSIVDKEPMRAKLADKRSMAKALGLLGLYLTPAPPHRVCQYNFERNGPVTYGIPRPFQDSERGSLIWILNRYLERNEPAKSNRHRTPLGLK